LARHLDHRGLAPQVLPYTASARNPDSSQMLTRFLSGPRRSGHP
jgi:hypothetical protein